MGLPRFFQRIYAAAGGVLAYAGNSAGLGFFVPLFALGLAYLQADDISRKRQGALLVAIVCVLACFRVLSFRPGYPGERALFGWRPALS